MADKNKRTGGEPQAVVTADIPWKKMTYREKGKYIIRNITVEPLMAGYIMPCVLAMLATQNLNLEKACRVNLGYDEKVCNALTARQTANYTEEETEVQQLVARMTIWKTALQSSLPCIIMLFLGAWSDRHGRRKPCMLLPLTGEIVTCISLILCTYFFFEVPMEVVGFVEAVFPAITGGWFIMFMAAFSYIGDVTTVEMRTLRIGIANVFVSVGIPVGMALSGVLYREIGFYGVFVTTAVLYAVSFCYGFFMIKEVPRQKTDQEKKRIEALKQQKCWFVRDLFDIRHISETFRVAFKEGKNNRKMRVIMLMIACMVIIGPMHGKSSTIWLPVYSSKLNYHYPLVNKYR